MRYMVKCDTGPSPDQASGVDSKRRRSKLIRRSIAAVLLLFCCALLFQLMEPSDYVARPVGDSWGGSASPTSWIRWRVAVASSSVRSMVHDLLPVGPMGLIVKMALCFGAAALFIGGPRRV